MTTPGEASPGKTAEKVGVPEQEHYMAQAVELALKGVRGANPLVGAVLVSAAGHTLATGFHRGAGTLHAERDALQNILQRVTPEELSASTLYVTLEPCNHHGRQPPCVDAILEAGIGRVVFGQQDDSALASGGARRLESHGVAVVGGVLHDECTYLNHRWSAAVAQGRPFVTAHLAQTLDARIAAEDGTSQWITSAESRAHTHVVRTRIDAILVGTGTVAVDDPRLTARTEHGNLTQRQPLRCVMGTRETSLDKKLTQGKSEGDGWIQLRTHDPDQALRTLADLTHHGHPIKHVLVEGGQNILSAFIAADLVDEIFLYQAPSLFGSGRGSVGDLGVRTLEQAHHLEFDHAEGGPIKIMGPDLCVHYQPSPTHRFNRGPEPFSSKESRY